MKNIPRKLINEKTYCVNYLVYLNDDEAREFIYIAVRYDKMPKFQEAVRQGNFDAEDYGIILEYGKGEASDEVKERMHLLYKCDQNSSLNVLDFNPEQG